MKHIITITLDIPAGMEAAVAHAAYMAQEAIGKQSREEFGALADAALLLRNASLDKSRPQEVQEVIDKLRAQAQRSSHAYTLLSVALSEISHTMSVADAEWRRGQAATEPSD